MRVQWFGGPLDGCEEEGERFGNVWSGPDPQAPTERVVIYLLYTCEAHEGTPKAHSIYSYSQEMTDRANHRPAEGG